MPQDIDVLEDLRDRVTSGAFEEGVKLRADVLRSDYGCAASTVREALLRLAAVGLVVFQEQRGFRMPVHSPGRQNDITKMRILLETEGATGSMEHGGIDWESRLSAAHHKLGHIETRMQQVGMSPDILRLWSGAELEFHQTLISACGSPTLLELHLTVYHRYRQIMVEKDKLLGDLAANIQEHRNIVDAALGGDPDVMRARIYEHFKRHLSPA